jgi:hypothetical protein
VIKKGYVMLTEKDKETLIAASTLIRIEARGYYDVYRRASNGLGSRSIKEANQAYEKVSHLERIARELDMIATGKL